MQRAEADLRACLTGLSAAALHRSGEGTARGLSSSSTRPTPRDGGERGGRAVRAAGFLDEPRWHGNDLEDRRLRIRLAQSLGEQILHSSLLRGVDVGRAAWLVDAAVRHEIWMLRRKPPPAASA